MRSVARMAAVLALTSGILVGGPAQSAESTAWDEPILKEVLEIWATARSDELLGRRKSAEAGYRRLKQALDGVQADDGAHLRARVFGQLREQRAVRLKELNDGRPLVDDLARARDVVAALARLKARADRSRTRKDFLGACLGYDALLRGCERARQLLPEGSDLTGLVWVEKRARTRRAEATANAVAPRRQGPGAFFRDYARRVPRADESLPAVEGFFDERVPAKKRTAVAESYLRRIAEEEPGETLRAARDVVDALQRAGTPAAELVAFADNLRSGQAPLDESGITMGQVSAGGDDFGLAALNVYLHVLRAMPDFRDAHRLVEKTLRAGAELERLEETAEWVRGVVFGERPGLLGVLLYRIERARGNQDEALRFMRHMLADPARFLPHCRASVSAMNDAFARLVDTGQLDAAAAVSERLVAYRPSDAPRLWLALGREHLASGQEAEGRRLLTQVAEQFPLRNEAGRARVILGGKGTKQGRHRILSAAELAEQARLAHANPGRYAGLARQYERAGRYADARDAYMEYARRFDSVQARFSAIQMYFEEGQVEQGLEEAREHVRRHPKPEALIAFIRQIRGPCVTAGRGTEWALFCIRSANRLPAEKAAPLLDSVCDVLCKDLARYRTRGKLPAELAAALDESPHRDRVLQLVSAKAEALRAELGVVTPRYTDVRSAVGARTDRMREAVGSSGVSWLRRPVDDKPRVRELGDIVTGTWSTGTRTDARPTSELLELGRMAGLRAVPEVVAGGRSAHAITGAQSSVQTWSATVLEARVRAPRSSARLDSVPPGMAAPGVHPSDIRAVCRRVEWSLMADELRWLELVPPYGRPVATIGDALLRVPSPAGALGSKTLMSTLIRMGLESPSNGDR
ncbi:MAG: tetratricopeptide repeat protein [bacterium]